MDRSFDDDRRNMFEQVKSLLLSKLMTIELTVKGVSLKKEIDEVKEWNFDSLNQVTKHDFKSHQKTTVLDRKSSIQQAPSLKNMNTVRT